MSQNQSLKIYRLATELNLSHVAIIDFLRKRGFNVKNHMSTVTEDMQRDVYNHFGKEKGNAERQERKIKQFRRSLKTISATKDENRETRKSEKHRDLTKATSGQGLATNDALLDTSSKIGTIVKGRVTKIVEYGAFIELENSCPGLIHKTEMPSSLLANKELKEGDTVDVFAVGIDLKKGRAICSIVKARHLRWQKVLTEISVGRRYAVKIVEKVDPGYFVAITESGIHGILHVTDLDWSFHKAEQMFSELQVGGQVEVLAIEINERENRVNFGIKQMGLRPDENDPWRKVLLGQSVNAKILQVYENFSLADIGNGICAQFYHDKKEGSIQKPEVGYTVASTVWSKNAITGVIAVASGIESVTPAASKSFLGSYVACQKEIKTLDTELSSLDELRKSYLWQLFDADEQKYLSAAFQKNENLFSPSFKINTVLYIRFDPLDLEGTWSRFLNDASAVFRAEIHSITDDMVAEKLLEKLSGYKYWYSQYDTREGETKFNLFNEFVSFYGDVKEGTTLQIRTVKFKGPAATHERERAMRRDTFALDVPVKFLHPRNLLQDHETAARAANLLREKVESFRILRSRQREAAVTLLTKGRDFRHFSDYLDAQIRALQLQTKELVLRKCRRVQELLDFVIQGKSESTIEFEEGDQIKIYGTDDATKPLSVGTVLEVEQDTMKFAVRELFDIEKISSGCRITLSLSLLQFRTQKENIERFLSGESENCNHIYHALHSSQTLEAPVLEPVDFIDPNLRSGDPENNQRIAVQKAVGNRNIFLVQGPPGTGKTTVISEVVSQLVARGERVLVTGQTHISVDNALERLSNDGNLELLRIGRNPRATHQDNTPSFSVEQQRTEFETKAKTLVQIRVDLLDNSIRGVLISDTELEKFVLARVKDWEDKNARSKARLIQYMVKDAKDFCDAIDKVDHSKRRALRQFYRDWAIRIETFGTSWESLLLLSRDVILGTCIGVSTSALMRNAGSELTFDTVIVDEAGKANISETLTAMSRAKRGILVGDHKQLPPFVEREILDELLESVEDKNPKNGQARNEIMSAITTSLFEKLQTLLPADHKVMLNKQFRMHPTIGNFISQAFYEGGVLHGPNTLSYRIPMRSRTFDGELLFFDTSNKERHFERSNNKTKENPFEARFIVNSILPALRESAVLASQIGIVTPYAGQAALLEAMLDERTDAYASRVEIATLDSFQGRELDIIVFSFTRSLSPNQNGTIGFLDDIRRLNVALSRARKKLVLVGDSSTLRNPLRHGSPSYAEVYERLFKYLDESGSLRKLML